MSIRALYTEEQIRNMNLFDYFRECSFDDILHTTRVLRVARYARESTNHEEQKVALENQIDRLDTMIENHAYFTLEERHKYTEHGISGRLATDRTAFNLMVDAASRREFDVIIVQDTCRFARNIEDLFRYIRVFKEYGIGVLILDGPYWTYNMSEVDILRLAIDAGMAQGESMRTATRVNNGVESYRKRGQLVISCLFGYILDKKVDKRQDTLIIHPIDSLTVRKIFELYTHPDAEKRMGSGQISNYLIEHGYKTAAGDLRWTPGKVIRILKNEKYMGYMLYGKFKVVDTMAKKKVSTHIEPIREDVYNEKGELIAKCNLIKGDWEPIVSEEVWWLAYEIRTGRASQFIYSEKGNLKNGLRPAKDVLANKSFCHFGYSRSIQYLHTARNGKPAQFRYTGRWQINDKSPEYREKNGLAKIPNQCNLEPVSEMKMWLMSLKVFEYVFGDSREEVLYTLKLLEESKKHRIQKANGKSLLDLQKELEKVDTQIENLYLDKLAGDIDANMCKKLAHRLEENKAEIERGIQDLHMQEARENSAQLNLEKIQERLSAYVDLTGNKVSEELLDAFVERIIFRANDEFVWEMNLSGMKSTGEKYRIKEYSEEYSKQLQSDENFNIIHTFVITVSECKEFVESDKVNRRFVGKYWRPITVKIAVK